MKRISLLPRSLLLVSLGVGLVLLGACTASAPNPESGDNGCICPAGFQCSQDGTQCLACTASCSGKQCGDDGCGGSCGGCGLYAQCDTAGLCQPTCELPPIAAPTTIDVNLQVFQVSGTVTRAGAPLADDVQERGRLLFRDRQTGRSFGVSLGSVGPAHFDSQLMAGTYTVLLDSTGPQTGLPRQQVVVRDGFVVDKDSTLSADLQVVDVKGSVTVNGQALPDDLTSRGQLRFRRSDGGSFSVDLGASGAGSYAVQLYSGSYDILVDSTNPAQTSLPKQQAVLLLARPLTADQQLNLDLKTVVFSGEVTRHRAPLPDSPTPRGGVVLARSDGGPQLLLPVPLTGPGRFSGTVYGGSYDLSFDSTSNQSILPRQIVPLASRVLLTRNQTATYDLRVAILNGLLTRNGVQLPDDANPRAEIVLYRTDNQTQARTALPSHGPAIYSLEVYIGNYNVLVDSSGTQSVLPQMTTLVQQNLGLTTDQRLDIPLHTARLSGRVTLDGADLPLLANSPGDLVLLDRRSGSALRAAVPVTGGGVYSLTVYPGSFALQFDSTAAAPPVLPPLVAALGNIEVGADARVDAPLTTFAVTGMVQRNGVAMPDEPSGMSRGRVSFVNKQTGSQVALDILGAGSARYLTTLYSGSYNVLFDATGPQSVLPQQQVQVRSGCGP